MTIKHDSTNNNTRERCPTPNTDTSAHGHVEPNTTPGASISTPGASISTPGASISTPGAPIYLDIPGASTGAPGVSPGLLHRHPLTERPVTTTATLASCV
ncbi:MAG: hypothetical protein R2735_05135 [Microthrixaceae bacterium]